MSTLGLALVGCSIVVLGVCSRMWDRRKARRKQKALLEMLRHQDALLKEDQDEGSRGAANPVREQID